MLWISFDSAGNCLVDKWDKCYQQMVFYTHLVKIGRNSPLCAHSGEEEVGNKRERLLKVAFAVKHCKTRKMRLFNWISYTKPGCYITVLVYKRCMKDVIV